MFYILEPKWSLMSELMLGTSGNIQETALQEQRQAEFWANWWARLLTDIPHGPARLLFMAEAVSAMEEIGQSGTEAIGGAVE